MNTRIFQDIDTKEQAYWLGFLYADGYISKNGRMVRLCLGIADEKQVDRFISFIDGDFARKRYYGPYKTCGKQVHFFIISKEMCGDLQRYGCYNRKSLTIRFPMNLREDLRLPFLMGIYDGDGTSARGNTTISSGSIDFLNDVKSIFSIKNRIGKAKQKNVCYRLALGRDVYEKMVESYKDFISLKNLNFIDVHKKGIETKKIRLKAQKTIERNLLEDSNFYGDKIFRKKFEVPKEELEKLINTIPMTKIGKMFGVTGNAVKKRAMALGIPYENHAGFWQKTDFYRNNFKERYPLGISKDELAQLILKMPITSVAKKLNVSEGVIRNRMKKYKIPFLGEGYWSKYREGNFLPVKC